MKKLKVWLLMFIMITSYCFIFIPDVSASDFSYIKTISYTHTQNIWRNGTTNQYFFSDTEYGLRYCTSDDGETFTLVDTVDDDANRGYFYVIGDGTYVYASLEWWNSPTYPNYIVAYSVSPTGLTEVGRVAVSNQESRRFWATGDHCIHINQLAKNMSAYYFDGSDFNFITDVSDGGWYNCITGDPDNENYIFCVRYLLSPHWYNVTVYYWDGASYTRINDYSDGNDINDPTPLKDSDYVLLSEFADGKVLLGFDGLDFYYYNTIDDSASDAYTAAGFVDIYDFCHLFWSERDAGISYYIINEDTELEKVKTIDNGNNLFNILCDNYNSLIYACYVGTGVVIYGFPTYEDVYVSGTMNSGWYNANHVHTVAEGLLNVSYGGNVYIWDGTYKENTLDILQPVNLIGNSSSVVTIDGETNDILWIDSYDVLVSGIKFYNASNCITTFGFDNITITDNYFNYSMAGYVTFSKETDLTIKKNIFNDLYYGVYIDFEFAESGSDILIYNNHFYYNYLNAISMNENVNEIRWNTTKTLGTNIRGGPYLKGNWWEDYVGEDIDYDGLGDTLIPYNNSSSISLGGDYGPLVEYEPYIIPSGNLTITNVYSEADCTLNLVYDIIVSNKNATQTYEQKNCNNDISIPISDLPYGNDTIILVSSEGYFSRLFYIDLVYSNDLNMSIYLPPKSTEGEMPNCILRPFTDSKVATGSDLTIYFTYPLEEMFSVEIYNTSFYGSYGSWVQVSEDLYVYNTTQIIIDENAFDDNSLMTRVTYYYMYCPPQLNAYLYQLTVTNRYETPLENVKIWVQRYINCTEKYENMSILYTDAAGHADIYLIPNAVYHFILNKTGFQESMSYYVPNNLIFTHDFIMDFLVNETIPLKNPYDYINFTASFTNNITINIKISDSSLSLQNAILYIYENLTLVNTTYITYLDMPYNSNYVHNSSRPNNTLADYTLKLYVYDHPLFNDYNFTIKLPKMKSSSLLLDLDTGFNFFFGDAGAGVGQHIGWVNIFLLCIGTFVIVSFGRYWAGIGVVSVGLVIALFEYGFGLPAFTGVQIISFIAFCVVLGVLVTIGINKQGRIN